MKDLLITSLTSLGYPIIQQGTLKGEYPDSFFTFLNLETNDDTFYDNQEHSCVWHFIVAFYSIDPQLTNTKLIDAKRLLRANGFICDGKGYDAQSDEPTHTGRCMNVLYSERY